MRRSSLFASAALALRLAGGGARPQDAVGVSAGPTVHYLLCSGDRIHTVRLTTPAGRTLWRIDSASGSQQSTYRAGSTPAGFRTVVPFRGLVPDARKATEALLRVRNDTPEIGRAHV